MESGTIRDALIAAVDRADLAVAHYAALAGAADGRYLAPSRIAIRYDGRNLVVTADDLAALRRSRIMAGE